MAAFSHEPGHFGSKKTWFFLFPNDHFLHFTTFFNRKVKSILVRLFFLWTSDLFEKRFRSFAFEDCLSSLFKFHLWDLSKIVEPWPWKWRVRVLALKTSAFAPNLMVWLSVREIIRTWADLSVFISWVEGLSSCVADDPLILFFDVWFFLSSHMIFGSLF